MPRLILEPKSLTLHAIMFMIGLGIFEQSIQAERPTEPFRLWPDGAPGAVGTETEDIPTLTPYWPAKGKATGAAFIVCPGGGYQGLADHEAEPVAQWMNELGIAAFVLKYRLAPRYSHPAPMLDAQRAIRTVRANAESWGIDPARIGILGFSAGGHLCSTAATHFDAGDPENGDPVERASSRPDLVIPIYPVITMTGEYTHAGSKRNLLGQDPPDDLVELMSNENQVTADSPPAFIVHGMDDKAVPVENAIMYARACVDFGVPVELHLYERGRHGFGLGKSEPGDPDWTPTCAAWLRLHSFTN